MSSPFSEFLLQIAAYGLESIGLYYGTYRGIVVSNQDPMNCGRLKVRVPQVHGKQTPDVWAFPKAPYASKGCGIFCAPDEGTWVYVSFDHGNPACPIWEGGWWGQDDASANMRPKHLVIRTPENLEIHFNRESKELTISLDKDLIKVSEGKILINSTKEAQVTSPKVLVTASDGATIKGATKVEGPLEVTGTVTCSDAKINNKMFSTHTHSNGNNGSPTGAPI